MAQMAKKGQLLMKTGRKTEAWRSASHRPRHGISKQQAASSSSSKSGKRASSKQQQQQQQQQQQGWSDAGLVDPVLVQVLDWY
jgi:hypothetical protein